MGTEWGFISPETGDFIGVSEEGMRKRWSARERPSALEITTALRAVQRAYLWHREGSHPTGQSAALNEAETVLAAILARLTEPDAGEGTEPPSPDGEPIDPPFLIAAATPDTTEARSEYQRGYSDGFRQLFEDMTAALTVPTPDTTEATLRAAMEDAGYLADAASHLLDHLTSELPAFRCEDLDTTRHFAQKVRAALQQPAVQPEGGLE